MSRIADWLIARAQRHPYYHLKRPSGDEYMRRWWLFGHGTERDRMNNGFMCNEMSGWFARWFSQYFVARVHQILLSDRDRDLHDHPAWNVSIVLRGGYWELTPHPLGSKWPFEFAPAELMPIQGDRYVGERCCAIWRRPGSIVFRGAKTRHKLVLPAGREAWSLFCLGRTTNGWGFYKAGTKIPHRQYDSTHSRKVV